MSRCAPAAVQVPGAAELAVLSGSTHVVCKGKRRLERSAEQMPCKPAGNTDKQVKGKHSSRAGSPDFRPEETAKLAAVTTTAPARVDGQRGSGVSQACYSALEVHPSNVGSVQACRNRGAARANTSGTCSRSPTTMAQMGASTEPGAFSAASAASCREEAGKEQRERVKSRGARAAAEAAAAAASGACTSPPGAPARSPWARRHESPPGRDGQPAGGLLLGEPGSRGGRGQRQW